MQEHSLVQCDICNEYVENLEYIDGNEICEDCAKAFEDDNFTGYL